MTCWDGAQGQVTSAWKVQKHDPIMLSPTRNPKPKTKNFKKI